MWCCTTSHLTENRTNKTVMRKSYKTERLKQSKKQKLSHLSHQKPWASVCYPGAQTSRQQIGRGTESAAPTTTNRDRSSVRKNNNFSVSLQPFLHLQQCRRSPAQVTFFLILPSWVKSYAAKYTKSCSFILKHTALTIYCISYDILQLLYCSDFQSHSLNSAIQVMSASQCVLWVYTEMFKTEKPFFWGGQWGGTGRGGFLETQIRKSSTVFQRFLLWWLIFLKLLWNA